MKRWFWLGLTLVFAITTISRHARAGDPELEFETLHTEHFNIHYHQGLEGMARTAAALCEEVHVDLAILLGWEVKGPTEVVIIDSTDSANGSANVFGRPVIRLFATAPDLDSSLQSYDHYLRTLITHEYVHINHLSIHGKVADVINHIFGDIYHPNQVAPQWIIEGLAVTLESKETSMGRVRSSLYQMYIRTMALEDTLLDLGQVSNSSRQYLRGSFGYLYGAFFMTYIWDKFGREKVVDIFHQYGKLLIPYGVNRAFEESLGQGVQSLYDEWIASVKAESESTRKRLEAQGLTPSRAVTSDGETKGQPVFAEDDKSVYMAIGNGWQETGVYRVPLDGADRELLFLSNSNTRISLDRSGRFYYARPAPHRDLYYFNDIFTADIQGSDPVRLTDGLRARYVTASPRGDRLAAVVNELGTSKLILTDNRGHRLETLIDSAPEDQVYTPVWSPCGKRIAAIIRRGPKVDLGIVDLEKGTVRFITNDRFFEKSPAFGPRGRYLVFVSDRTGVNNLYAFDFDTGELRQLTNVLTGAFAPAVSHDGRTLAFLKYSSAGYDLNVMPFTPGEAADAPLVESPFGAVKETPAPVDVAAKRYNPFPTFLPTHWMLDTSIDADWNVTLRAGTAFADIAGRHHLGTNIDYNTDSKVVAGRVGYAFDGLGPRVGFGLSRSYTPRDTGYYTGTRNRKWLQVITRGSVNLNFPIHIVDSSHGLSFGYSIVHAKPHKKPILELDPRGEMPTVPEEYFRAGLSTGWSYSDIVASPMGLAPHKGRRASTSIGLDHPALGGEQTIATFRYSWAEYFRMPWLEYHTLSFTMSGGVHISDPPNQAAFTVGGYAEWNEIDAIINNTSVADPTLRGYAPGSLQGSRLQAFHMTYRFPIWFTELAYGTVPLFLKNIQGSVFTDHVLISFEDFDRDDWYCSVGGTIAWIFSLGYYQNMRLSTGYARGLRGPGGNEFIIVLSGGG